MRITLELTGIDFYLYKNMSIFVPLIDLRPYTVMSYALVVIIYSD